MARMQKVTTNHGDRNVVATRIMSGYHLNWFLLYLTQNHILKVTSANRISWNLADTSTHCCFMQWLSVRLTSISNLG